MKQKTSNHETVKLPRFDDFSWDSWLQNSLPSQVWNLVYFSLGLFTYTYLWPSIGSCTHIQWQWVSLVFARNFCFLWIFFGGAHVYLYILRKVPDEKKFNKSFPDQEQHRRDCMYSHLSFLITSCFEVFYIWCLANNYISWHFEALCRAR